MGRLNEQIKYFSENLNVRIAKNRSEQIKNLAEELGKKVASAYKNKGIANITFTSQELRTLVISLEKVHKTMNKQVSFIEFEKKIMNLAKKNKGKTLKETQEIHWEIYKEQVKIEQQLMIATFNIQWAVAKINMLCTVLSIYENTLERDKAQKEKEDSEILTHCIFEALVEASEL